MIETQPRLTASKRHRGRAALVGRQAAVGPAGDQLGTMGQGERGLHLAGVIVRLLEDVAEKVAEDGVPVAEEQVGGRPAVHLPHDPLQIVPAVAVQEHDLADARPHQRLDQVAGDRPEGRGVKVHGEGELRLVGLRAVGDGGQQDDFRPAAMGLLANPFAHQVPFQRVHAVGEVKIVRLDGAERQHRHLVVLLLYGAVVGFGQFPGTHGSWLSRWGASDFQRRLSGA